MCYTTRRGMTTSRRLVMLGEGVVEDEGVVDCEGGGDLLLWKYENLSHKLYTISHSLSKHT